MKNIYIVKIPKKYLKNILRYSINISKIQKKDDFYLLYLNYSNYDKILKFKNIFNIELIGYDGFIKYKKVIAKYYLFFILLFISILYIIFLSNIIFKIEIKTSNKEIADLVLKELSNNNLNLYKFVLDFNAKEKVKKNILENNKDRLEWLEITRFGTKYTINVEERIINKFDIDTKPRDIVALKNAIILKIEAKSGSIVKKLNDYVKKGDVIVTGKITHKDEVVDLVKADAKIYGETWYTVHVSYPYSYYEKIKTGNSLKRFSFTFFNKKYNFGNSYKEESINETKIIYNKILPIKLSREEVFEVITIDDLYTIDEAYSKAFDIAKNKLLDTIPNDSKILNQKKLKIIVNNSTIDVDIFFKVYENITDIIEIKE